MFLNFSWTRQRSLELLVVALACSVSASATLAETAIIRLVAHFRDAAGYPLQNFESVGDVLARLSLGTRLYVRDVNNCQELVGVPLGKENGYDTLRNTYTVIQSIKVGCWAILQIAPTSPVTASGAVDRITPDMVHGIMADAQKLSAQDDEWLKALTTFPGGVIACEDEERCLLSLPDGKNPPDESVLFELIAAQGDERFVLVTQMYRGQAGFVYGIRWRETEGGGEVISIFPDLRQ